MNQAEFMVAVQQRGATGTDKLYCGVYEGYPFAVTYKSGKTGGMLTYVLQMQFATEVPTTMYKQIRTSFKGRADMAAAATQDKKLFSITVVLRDSSNFNAVFDDLLAMLVAQARENGLALPAICPLCNAGGCDSFAYVRGAFRPVHRNCVDTLVIANQTAVEKNELQGNYALGALGALLGALVGTIPSIVVIVFFDYILSLLCALVPICAYYGYKLFRGRMNNLSLVFIGLATFLMVPVTHYATIAFYVWREEGFIASPALYIRAVSASFSNALPALLQILLFMGLGFIISFGYVRRGNQDKLVDISFITSTLRPIPAGSVAAAPPPPQ